MPDDITMTMTLPDGTTTGPFDMDTLKAAVGAVKKGKAMKADPDFAGAEEKVYSVTARELRAFIERFERIEEEKREAVKDQKEVMAEAKARGYDTKVLRKLIALRKKDPADVSEEEALLAVYKQALGMD